MTTVLGLLEGSMREIGALAIEETPTAAEAQFCQTKLNEMLASWSTESLTVYSVISESFPVVAGKASYTMGPTGDLNTARPIRIVEIKTVDNQGNVFPVGIIDYDQYSSILPPYIQSPLAQFCYSDNNFPLTTLYPWPIWNDGSYFINVWSWQAFPSFANLTTTIVLPPGYDRAIKYNLALEISPSFGKPISGDLAGLASVSKSDLKRLNMDILQMGFDNALLKRPGGWNWQAQCFGGVS